MPRLITKKHKRVCRHWRTTSEKTWDFLSYGGIEGTPACLAYMQDCKELGRGFHRMFIELINYWDGVGEKHNPDRPIHTLRVNITIST